MVPAYFDDPLRLDSSAPHMALVMTGGIGAPMVAAPTVETGRADSSGAGSSASSSVTGLSRSTTDVWSGLTPPGVSIRTCTPSASPVSRGSVPNRARFASAESGSGPWSSWTDSGVHVDHTPSSRTRTRTRLSGSSGVSAAIPTRPKSWVSMARVATAGLRGRAAAVMNDGVTSSGARAGTAAHGGMLRILPGGHGDRALGDDLRVDPGERELLQRSVDRRAAAHVGGAGEGDDGEDQAGSDH